MNNMKPADIAKAVVAAVAVGVGIYMLVPEGGSDAVEASPVSQAQAPVASEKQTVPTGGCEALPVRMMTAPNADQLTLAARLLREAADPRFAAATIQVHAARDLAQAEAEMWKYKSEKAEREAKAAEAQARIAQIQKGEYTPYNLEGDGMATRARNEVLGGGISGESKVGKGGKGDSGFRLKGVGQDGKMLFSKGDEWYRNVGIGQYMGSVRVDGYDADLGCAILVDTANETEDGSPKTIPVCLI